MPDVKKAQESWLKAKREHALAAERQARETAAREAKLEAERAAKVSGDLWPCQRLDTDNNTQLCPSFSSTVCRDPLQAEAKAAAQV